MGGPSQAVQHFIILHNKVVFIMNPATYCPPEKPDVTYCTTSPAEHQAQAYVDRIARTFAGSDVTFHLAGSVFSEVNPVPGVTVDVTGGDLVQRLF